MAEHPLVSGLRWILANRRQPNGKPWNPSALGRAALNNRSHVGLILKGEIDPAGVQGATVAKLARTARVSAAWLQTGEGEPGPEPADRYPERDAELSSFPDIDPEIRQIVSSMQLLRGVRPSRAVWRGMIEGLILAKARGEKLTEPSVETEDEVPPIARREK